MGWAYSLNLEDCIEAISVFEVVRENTIGDSIIKWFDISLLFSHKIIYYICWDVELNFLI